MKQNILRAMLKQVFMTTVKLCKAEIHRKEQNLKRKTPVKQNENKKFLEDKAMTCVKRTNKWYIWWLKKIQKIIKMQKFWMLGMLETIILTSNKDNLANENKNEVVSIISRLRDLCFSSFSSRFLSSLRMDRSAKKQKWCLLEYSCPCGIKMMKSLYNILSWRWFNDSLCAGWPKSLWLV